MQEKIKIGWFSFSCCEDNTVVMTEVMNGHWQEWKQIFDFRHVRVLKSKNIYDALNQGKVVFLNVKNYDGSYGHALAIVGMKGFDGEKAESLIIHDVWVGPYREFKFTSNDTLEQPEGYTNYINKSLLFYIK